MKFSTLPVTLFSVLIVMVFISCGNEKSNSQNQPEEKQGRQLEYETTVTFINNDGENVSTIRAALADEQQERNQGLMDVNEMPADAGMLFIFPNEEPRSFYMANTPLSLDIIFVGADSTIVRIHQNTTPFNSEQLLSKKPAKYVVETNAGYCIANDIQEGMKIRF